MYEVTKLEGVFRLKYTTVLLLKYNQTGSTVVHFLLYAYRFKSRYSLNNFFRIKPDLETILVIIYFIIINYETIKTIVKPNFS